MSRAIKEAETLRRLVSAKGFVPVCRRAGTYALSVEFACNYVGERAAGAHKSDISWKAASFSSTLAANAAVRDQGRSLRDTCAVYMSYGSLKASIPERFFPNE